MTGQKRLSTETIDLFEGTDHAPSKTVFRGWTYRPQLDEARLENAQARVLRAMLSERWFTIQELREIGGTSGDRRARQLRDPELGGFDVEVVRAADVPANERPEGVAEPAYGASGVWLYRIRPGSVTRKQIETFIQAVRPKRKAP